MTKPQFIQTPGGGELVVLSREDYDNLLAAARDRDEDADDIAAFDAAMADAAGATPLPPAVSAALMKGDSLLRAWRKHRGLTQVQLAQDAAIGQGFLSELESADRTKKASKATVADLARALDLDPAMLAHLTAERI